MQGTTPRPHGAGRLGRGIAVAAALSVAIAGSAASVTAQDDLDVLNVAHAATVTTWDPVASFSTEAQYLANMYEPLIYATPAGAAEDFEPGLATSWSVSEDGLTWTFELEEGVTFHDGEAFNAEAAKASIEAARDPEGRAGAWWIWPGIESIETPAEHTLVVNLSAPAALDLVAASTYAAWMVSPAALAAADEDPEFFETAGASFGTGPYMLESHTPGTEVLLTQFPDYRKGWDGADHYEKVLVQILDSVNQQQALEGGNVLAANRIPPESVDDVDAADGFTVYSDPSLFNYVGLFNTQRAPLDNPLVRQALAYATPYEDIIEVSTLGQAVQDRASVPPGVFPYSEDVPQYSYDLEKAKELMAEAGLEDGFDLEITYAAENAVHPAYAPLLQAAWAELGVNVTITPMPWSQQWERGKGEPDGRQDLFLLLYWPTYSDAGSDNLASLWKSSEAPFFNLSYWANEEFDALIDQAISETGVDRDAAQATYEEAMNLLVEESPGLFFLDTNSVVALSDELTGYEYNLNYPYTQFFFYDLIPAA